MSPPVYNLLLLALDAGLLIWVGRGRRWSRLVVALVALGGVSAVLALIGSAGEPMARFVALGLWAWAVFGHAPLVSVGGWLLLREKQPWAGRLALGLAASILLLAAQAFLIEPRWLEVSHHVIETSKLAEPLRLVVVADLQTDEVGEWEREVLERALAEAPDALLFAGDYLDLSQLFGEERERQTRALGELFAEVALTAPLGVFAVGGNVDARGWSDYFSGVPGAVCFEEDATVTCGPLSITGLGLRSSRSRRLELDRPPGFHLVLGHFPDFALGEVPADLLLAGHCHGGQVRLPGIGALMKLSAIPRRWTEGLHEIHPGTWLCVSRGLGMERGRAPELRFLCRPELVVIDLVPSGTPIPQLVGRIRSSAHNSSRLDAPAGVAPPRFTYE